MAKAKAAPRCSLLFADSFQHDRVGQHVDEVRFTEPVVITACEIVELHQISHCPSLRLKGTTYPESCAVEIYVRNGGDARFQRLGPAFLHSPAATSLLDVEAAVTEHLVLRGSYKSITLVIYGNLASELSLECNLEADISFLKDTPKSGPVQVELDAYTTTALPAGNLRLIRPWTVEQEQLLHRLLKCIAGADTTQHLVSLLLTAAASCHLSQHHLVKGAQWCPVKKLNSLDGPHAPCSDDTGQDLLGIHDWVQLREEEAQKTTTEQEDVQAFLQLSQCWLQAGLEFSPRLHPPLSAVESLIGGLAAVQLLCNKGAQYVLSFVIAGGMNLLLQVVQEVSGTTALLLLALTSIECASRHGSACEALLSGGKDPFLVLLHKTQCPPVRHLLHQILQRLQCFQIVSAFELLVDRMTNASAAEDIAVIEDAAKLLNDLLDALSDSCSGDSESAQYCLGNLDAELLSRNVPGNDKVASVSLDIDPALLSLLKEKRFMPSLVAFSSVPNIWTATGGLLNACAEFAAATYRLLLLLLSCRSGLLFINNDTKAAATMISILRNSSEQRLKFSPIRHAAVLTSLGFLCTPRDLAGILESSILVMSAADHLVGADNASDAAFKALWDLAAISRSESGRQAVLAVVWFPEVLTSLMEVLQSAPEPTCGVGAAARHCAAEVLQRVFCDAALTNQIVLTMHAFSLQSAVKAACKSGMGNCSKILEWVEAAVIYEKKGAVGLLKHASALIGPLNISASVHVDGSMDGDANNLHDRGLGAEMPTALYKGTMTALIQDSAVHALTISLKLLAASSWDEGVAASLYGEDAIGVVSTILEHCVACLQASSNDYDDEDAEEEEGRGEDQQSLALLLPTLLLLLSLLKRVQALVQQYCSTRIVDLLLRLHHVVSAKAGAYGTVPPYAWTGGVLEVGVAQQLLASLLAFWPISGWTPALLPRLLGPNSTSLPVEPGDACSVICLLEECLPPECPRLCLDRAAVVDVYRSVAVGSMYGLDVMSAAQWQTSASNTEKMLLALYPHLEQLGQLILCLAPSTCDLVQERLTSLVTRLACQNVEHAAILVRPVLLLLQQRTLAASGSSLSEIDILQVERMLQWLALLAVHPSSKAVLLQEGAVQQVLVQALSLASPSSKPTASPRLGWLFWSCKAVAPICDISVSYLPGTSVDRHIAEDCPDFDDCCAIASCLVPLIQIMPMDKNTKVLAVALEKLASHDLGRAALASVAEGQSDTTAPTSNSSPVETELSSALDRDSPPFLRLWQDLAASVISSDRLKPVHVGLLKQFAHASIVLSDSGRSAYGLGALRAIFGLSLVPETSGRKTVEEIVQPLLQVISTLEHHITEVGGTQPTYISKASLQEVHSAVSVLLSILKAPSKVCNLKEEIESLVGLLPAPRPIAERRAEALRAQSSCWRMLPSEIPAEDIVLMDVETSETSNSNVRGTLPWECSRLLQERPVMAMSISKRRVISTIEVASKRLRVEGSASTVIGRTTTVVVTSNRRDTFRQRKPNTSRPPSMHVDDYVAREKSSDAPGGSNPVTQTPPLQRSNSSQGRPPSIHVDEFMARQRERHQPAVPSVSETFVENGASTSGLDFPEVAEDGPNLGFVESSSHVSQATVEYSRVSVTVSGVSSYPANTRSPPVLEMTSSAIPSGSSIGLTPHSEAVNKPECLQRNTSSLSTSAPPEPTNFSSWRNVEIKKEQNSGVASAKAENHNQPPASLAMKVKLERAPSTNSRLSGPATPAPPAQPYEKEASAMESPFVKRESKHQLDQSNSVQASIAEVPAVPSSNFAQSASFQKAPPSNTTAHLIPAPPASLPVWLNPPRLLDIPLLQPAMPVRIPHMNVGLLNHGSTSRPPADLQVGGAVLQPPGGLWRESPTFSSLPPPVPLAPSPMQHGSPFVQQSYGASRPLEYPVNHTATSSSSDQRFGNYTGPLPGQGPSPPYHPPLPAGMPPPQSVLQSQQSGNRPPPLSLHDAEISAQQEPGAVLQQILASPETIQDLLKDPKKLQLLLEQHPKLITLLQEKMSHGLL